MSRLAIGQVPLPIHVEDSTCPVQLEAAAPPSPVLTYRAVWPSAGKFHEKILAEFKLLGPSSLVAVDAATFQKGSDYTRAPRSHQDRLEQQMRRWTPDCASQK